MKNSLNPSEATSINPVLSSNETEKIFPPGIYLVATPIGNAGDITLRALDVLRRADRIACEDTRVTAPLLRRYGIKTPLTPYHDHNGAVMRPKLLARIRAGEAIALVSDAGTPLISDPGYKLVRAALNEGLFVTSLPGASAALTALQLSGLPSNRFLFVGFPDAKSGARRTLFRTLVTVPATLIFFEGPSRLIESLTEMAEIFGPRQAALARELTKCYEEIRRASLTELARHYAEMGPPRGEIVLVVAPPETSLQATEEDLDGLLYAAFETHSLKDAAEFVATATGFTRRKVYQRALALVKEGDF